MHRENRYNLLLVIFNSNKLKEDKLNRFKQVFNHNNSKINNKDLILSLEFLLLELLNKHKISNSRSKISFNLHKNNLFKEEKKV
jgi:hypothetical protein